MIMAIERAGAWRRGGMGFFTGAYDLFVIGIAMGACFACGR